MPGDEPVSASCSLASAIQKSRAARMALASSSATDTNVSEEVKDADQHAVVMQQLFLADATPERHQHFFIVTGDIPVTAIGLQCLARL